MYPRIVYLKIALKTWLLGPLSDWPRDLFVFHALPMVVLQGNGVLKNRTHFFPSVLVMLLSIRCS